VALGQATEPGVSLDQSQAQKWTFEDAEALAGKGRLDQAMNILNQLAAQTPEPAGVERLKGIIYYQKNELTQAVQAFQKAIAQDVGDHESLEMEGVSLFRLGRPQDALPYLEKARTAVQSANVDPEYVLGLCYADVARYDDARHAFAAQYGFAPDSAEAHLLAARLFLRRELRDQAAAQAEKALVLNPKLPLAHQLLGEAALARGDLAGAIKELEAERAINPLDGELYGRLGDAYLRAGQFDDAQRALNRAVLLEPYATEPYILLGETFLKLKDPVQALHYLDHAEKMDPSNYITHNLLGQAYKATGQLAEANREFKTVVEIQHRSDPKPVGQQ
jgi:tetratricopeptide (TPR) repeat protein